MVVYRRGVPWAPLLRERRPDSVRRCDPVHAPLSGRHGALWLACRSSDLDSRALHPLPLGRMSGADVKVARTSAPRAPAGMRRHRAGALHVRPAVGTAHSHHASHVAVPPPRAPRSDEQRARRIVTSHAPPIMAGGGRGGGPEALHSTKCCSCVHWSRRALSTVTSRCRHRRGSTLCS